MGPLTEVTPEGLNALWAFAPEPRHSGGINRTNQEYTSLPLNSSLTVIQMKVLRYRGSSWDGLFFSSRSRFSTTRATYMCSTVAITGSSNFSRLTVTEQ